MLGKAPPCVPGYCWDIYQLHILDCVHHKQQQFRIWANSHLLQGTLQPQAASGTLESPARKFNDHRTNVWWNIFLFLWCMYINYPDQQMYCRHTWRHYTGLQHYKWLQFVSNRIHFFPPHFTPYFNLNHHWGLHDSAHRLVSLNKTGLMAWGVIPKHSALAHQCVLRDHRVMIKSSDSENY